MIKERPFAFVPDMLYIGGEWREASDGSRFLVTDPATGDVLASVASASAADAVAAVEVATKAGRDWAAVPARERAEILRQAFESMTEHRHELAELIVRENGKSWDDALAEVKYAAEFFRWYSEEGVRIAGQIQTAPDGDKRILVIQQPIGTSVLVTPWNFPAAMATRKIAPALAAGCAVVLKPASDTPLTALAIAHLLAESGVPEGVVNVIPAHRSGEVVKAMLRHPKTRKLSFTGSTEVGRALLREASEQIINVSMELGGNAPFLVFEDADLEAAVEGAVVAKMRNGGQSCIAANRFFIHSSLYDEFACRLAKELSALSIGHGMDQSVKLGPMINHAAVSDISELVSQSVAAGANIVTGGKLIVGPGAFFPPTVLTGVAAQDPILAHEVFGPVAPLVPFDTEGEAITLANATPFGLASYVYTTDLTRALRVSEALETGMVGVNRGFISDPAAPFGGVKQSGLGREGGHHGLHEFMETKYIAVDW